MPKTEEVEMLTKQNEDTLIARMKMFVHLRQDLERVCLLSFCCLDTKWHKNNRTVAHSDSEKCYLILAYDFAKWWPMFIIAFTVSLLCYSHHYTSNCILNKLLHYLVKCFRHFWLIMINGWVFIFATPFRHIMVVYISRFLMQGFHCNVLCNLICSL